MKRRIDTIGVLDISNKIKKEIEKLEEYQNKLLTDVNNINDFYKGIDASLIITKYLEKINNLKCVIKTLNDYVFYFNDVIGLYQNNYDRANEEMYQVDIAQDIFDINTDLEPNLSDIKISLGGINE